MKLGFMSAILPDQTLEQVVEFAADTDFECLELMCWPKGKAERKFAGVTHIDVTDLTAGQADEIKGLVKENDIEISGLGYYPNPLAPDTEEAQVYIEHIKKVIKAAAMLDVGVVNTFIGRDWTKSVDDNWPRFMQVWPDLIAFAEENGVKIGIENCPMFFTNDEWPGGKNLASTPEIWDRMFNDIESDNFGLNFDPSHFVWQQMDYLVAIREFASKLFHVHAKDVRVDKHRLDRVGIMANPLQYHTPKLPGLGEVNWGRFLSVLSDTGYNGAVCIEVEDPAYEGPVERRQAAILQSGTFLNQFM